MIKKLKIGLLIVALSLIGFSSAYAADLSWTADQTVSIDSANYTIESGSAATSIIVGATTLVVTVPSGSTFTLSSANNYNLYNSPNTSGVFTCTAAKGSLVITGPQTSNTITPDKTTTCQASGGSSGGSSGGGSSSKPPVTPPVTPAPGCSAGNLFNASTGLPCTSASTPVSCSPGQMFNGTTGERCTSVNLVFCPPGQMFNETTGERCNTTVGASAGPGASGYAFGSGLVKLGTKGEACRAWQHFFNDKAGAGLVADGWCGKLTIAAAKAWQTSMGLVSDGLLGAMSRAKANAQ